MMNLRGLFASIRDLGRAKPTSGPESPGSSSLNAEVVLKIVEQLGNPDSTVRWSAIDALVASGSSARLVVPKLVTLFENPDHNVRRDAVRALGELGPLSSSVISKVVDRLADESNDVRRRARIAVLQIDPEGNALLDALENSNARIRKSAIDALPRLTSLPVPPTDALIRRLPNQDAEISEKISEILVKIGGPAVPVLISSLNDDRSCRRAIGILAKMKQTASPAIGTLVNLVHSGNASLAKEIVSTLGKIGPDAIPALVRLLDDTKLDALLLRRTEFDVLFNATYGIDPPKHTVSRAICDALVTLDSGSELIAALKHPREHVRECAASALAKMSRAKEAAPALISALEDVDERVQTAATATLEIILDPTDRVETLLATLLRQRDVPRGLWSLVTNKTAVRVLMTIHQSVDSGVRNAAATALGRILPALAELRLHPDYVFDYRSMTFEGLSELLETRPDIFDSLSRLHSPDKLAYFTGPPRRGRERLPELATKVQGQKTLLLQAEAEIASMLPEPPRYTDLIVYDGHLYPGDVPSPTATWSDDKPLVAGEQYTLEVAIRLTRKGIGSDRAPDGAVKNPRQDREVLSVFVAVNADSDTIGIDEPFVRIDWPYNEDSGPAFFRLDVGLLPAGNQLEMVQLEVRLYDQSLDLLDIVHLSTAVCLELPGESLPNAPNRRVTWPNRPPDTPCISMAGPVRCISINVGPDHRGTGYLITFTFLDPDKKEIRIPGTSRISTNDLEVLMAKVRDFWTDLVITNYADDLTVSRATYGKYLGRLRELGIQAWSLLFGTRYAARKGASETIGELLANVRLQEGGYVQITHSHRLDFIFPWSILHPVVDDAAPVDPLQFWGARYRIEQVTKGSSQDLLDQEPVTVIFSLDKGFGNSDRQRQLFVDYKTAAAGKLIVSDAVSNQQQLFAELTRHPAAHLYYFYCHGYAQAAPSVLKRDGVMELKKKIQAIAEGSAERNALETLLRLTSRMDDESWIYVGDSEIRESKIRLQPFFKTRHPIVFLNMCQSADLAPSMSNGLIRVFLDHSASAVIGTESPMTSVFAGVFGQAVLDELFAGSDIGTALWKARRHFLSDDLRNPLGLAYTLYGRAAARLGGGTILGRTVPQRARSSG